MVARRNHVPTIATQTKALPRPRGISPSGSVNSTGKCTPLLSGGVKSHGMTVQWKRCRRYSGGSPDAQEVPSAIVGGLRVQRHTGPAPRSPEALRIRTFRWERLPAGSPSALAVVVGACGVVGGGVHRRLCHGAGSRVDPDVRGGSVVSGPPPHRPTVGGLAGGSYPVRAGHDRTVSPSRTGGDRATHDQHGRHRGRSAARVDIAAERICSAWVSHPGEISSRMTTTHPTCPDCDY
jgi:hypothetical protein